MTTKAGGGSAWTLRGGRADATRRSSNSRAACQLRRACALCLALVVSVWCAARTTAAAEPELRITLQHEQHLSPDAHTSVSVLVALPEASADMPLLLTPHIEGAAVELVRGRLLRSDAKPADHTHLRFEIPVVARSKGTAILKVSIWSYLCDTQCRRVAASASSVLDVR